MRVSGSGYAINRRRRAAISTPPNTTRKIPIVAEDPSSASEPVVGKGATDVAGATDVVGVAAGSTDTHPAGPMATLDGLGFTTIVSTTAKVVRSIFESELPSELITNPNRNTHRVGSRPT